MRAILSILASVIGVALVPTLAHAHPHLWVQQAVRVIVKDGRYTAIEIEWKFDPFSSEIEIPLIDEDKDGKFSPREAKLLADDMMPELQKFGFMTWLNTGGKDFRPSKPSAFTPRIDDPATFTLPDWDRSAGDGSNNMQMPQNKRASEPPGPRNKGPRNLVYVMRFDLPQPSKFVSVTTLDPDDFIRIEVDKGSVPAGCTLAKHPVLKAEFIRGYPIFADIVTCQLP